MIRTDQDYAAALARITWFQQQVAHLRKSEPNPANYKAAASGFLAEIDRMQSEVREFLGLHPSEFATSAVPSMNATPALA